MILSLLYSGLSPIATYNTLLPPPLSQVAQALVDPVGALGTFHSCYLPSPTSKIEGTSLYCTFVLLFLVVFVFSLLQLWNSYSFLLG